MKSVIETLDEIFYSIPEKFKKPGIGWKTVRHVDDVTTIELKLPTEMVYPINYE